MSESKVQEYISANGLNSFEIKFQSTLEGSDRCELFRRRLLTLLRAEEMRVDSLRYDQLREELDRLTHSQSKQQFTVCESK